ncbi:MAG: hypothetical protein KAT31_02050 [Bacteroidales bacterium]|nr:hypothetical protein [Bacteroidales bacterium]
MYDLFLRNENYNTALDTLLEKLLAINETFADIKLDLNIAEKFITKRIQ